MAYTTIDNPELYFQSLIWTGNGATSRALTLDGDENMQPDWVWIKQRTGSTPHKLFDVIRGVQKSLKTNSTDGEATDDENGFVTAFSTDGFTVGTGSSGVDDVNAGSNSKYVSWNWSAGGSASSNSNGSITSSVSANTTAGFSIVSYTATNANATVGHGLSSALDMLLVKNRDSTKDWRMWFKGFSGTERLEFNNTEAKATTNTSWNGTVPSSSLFSLGNDSNTNNSTDDYIAYCFHSIKGYSKFGSYNGSGNVNGPFIHTGFKPAMIIGKATSRVDVWWIHDNKRSTFNPMDDRLMPDTATAEGVEWEIDYLSNGFKLRTTDAQANGSGEKYIYWAFAESPFVNSKGVPTMAR